MHRFPWRHVGELCSNFLRFRLILLYPGLIDDGFASGLSNQYVQLYSSLAGTLLAVVGMRVFLDNDIVIIAVENVESNIRLYGVLGEESSAVSDHGDPAGVAGFPGATLYHQRHVVIVCVTVADEKEIEGFHVVSLLSVHQYTSQNLIILSTILDGEYNALEVILVAFVHQVISKASRDQIRRII